MTAVVVVGAQWGDEGKGKVVDLVTEHADMVVRYAGGPNAGHTLVVGDDKIVLRLVPSGVLQPRAACVMGQGMVIDLAVLLGEIDALEARGVKVLDRLAIADRAHLILPHHIAVDCLREAGSAQKIGTTKRGIGPCYEDKAARRGLRLGDLRDPAEARRIVGRSLDAWRALLGDAMREVPSAEQTVDALLARFARVSVCVGDASHHVDRAIRKKARVLFEGAQGTLLDVDHGTYPFVTSSSAVAGGACTGSGVGPSRIDRVIGITKAYTTRVGEGPFPTELLDDVGETLRRRGGEFGSVTGRPRRTGWLDLPALRYAARVNGVDRWALTKLDVLTGFDEVEVCVAYDTPRGRERDVSMLGLEHARPVMHRLPGWKEDLAGCRALSELPPAARAFCDFVAAETEVPFALVSVGARRDETIVVTDVFA